MTSEIQIYKFDSVIKLLFIYVSKLLNFCSYISPPPKKNKKRDILKPTKEIHLFKKNHSDSVRYFEEDICCKTTLIFALHTQNSS